MRRLAALFGVLFPLTLAVVPGWGHIWLRRYNRGLALFFLCFGALNLRVVIELLADPGQYRFVKDLTIALAIGVLVFSLVDVLRITIWLKSKTVVNRRKQLYRKALTHYLRSEYGQAEDAALRMIRTNPLDAQALLVLGMIQREDGRRKKAMGTFKRALRGGLAGTWKADLERELEVTRRP